MLDVLTLLDFIILNQFILLFLRQCDSGMYACVQGLLDHNLKNLGEPIKQHELSYLLLL